MHDTSTNSNKLAKITNQFSSMQLALDPTVWLSSYRNKKSPDLIWYHFTSPQNRKWDFG